MSLKSLIEREHEAIQRWESDRKIWQIEADETKKFPELANNKYWMGMIEQDRENLIKARNELAAIRYELAEYIRELLAGKE